MMDPKRHEPEPEADASRLSDMASSHDHVEDATPAQMRESAYRRGFHQGLYRAIEIMGGGGDLKALDAYGAKVAEWRFRRIADGSMDDEGPPPYRA